MGDPPQPPGPGLDRGAIRPPASPPVHAPGQLPQAPGRQPRRALSLLGARRLPLLPPPRVPGRVRLPRHDLRHALRTGAGRRPDGDADADQHRRVRAGPQRRGGHPHRAGVEDAGPAAAQRRRARARDGAAGHPRDPFRKEPRATVAPAPGAGPRAGRGGAATDPLRGRAGAEARVRRHVPHLRGCDGHADVARRRQQHEHLRRDRPVRSTWRPRTTRCARTPTPR